MRVLLIGGGGREHALAKALSASGRCDRLYLYGGNPAWGLGRQVPEAALGLRDLAVFAREEGVGLAMVGPEAALIEGVADFLRQERIPTCGPGRELARLESDKAYAKSVFQTLGLPTARGLLVRDRKRLSEALLQFPPQVVVKANGPAAGKGVAVCDRRAEAEAFAERVFDEGHEVLLEERLFGREVSLMVLSDGRHAVALPLSQDHKRLLDGDRGPNTGGMGAVAPVGGDEQALCEQLAEPLVAHFAGKGTPYRGVLYFGLMVTQDGPYILECNVRLGDPETQALLPLIGDDLLDVLEAAATDGLYGARLRVRPDRSVAIVLAASGYPQSPKTGSPISGLDGLAEDVGVFLAGVRDAGGRLVTSGGRVMAVQALAPELGRARQRALDAAEQVAFEGKIFRRDIGAACDRG